MRKKDKPVKIWEELFVRKLIMPTLLAAACTVMHISVSEGSGIKTEKAISEFEYVQDEIPQEAVHVFHKENEPASLRINIAGQPKVHFKVYYSETEDENTFRLLPDGHGEIGEDGIVSHMINIERFPKKDFFLKVFTSGDCNFLDNKTMTTAKPFHLVYTQKTTEGKTEKVGWFDTVISTLNQPQHGDNPRRPTAVTAVRGSLPLTLPLNLNK